MKTVPVCSDAQILPHVYTLNHNRIGIGRGYSVDHAVQHHVYSLFAHTVSQNVRQGRRPSLEANLGRVQRLSSPVWGQRATAKEGWLS